MNFRALLLGTSAATLAWCGSALGQETSSGSEDQPITKLQEVVVTAERRVESLQTTAIAASVLTGEDLLNRGTGVVDQLQFVAPSVTVNNFGQGIDFNIRGIGKGEHNTQTMTGVVTYRDSVASFPGYFTEEPYYDIASVEILRGPQGTFAGLNSTGGAVFVNSRDPVIDGGYQGYVQGQVGNYNDFGLQGAVNLPLGSTLAARIAINGETRDSFYHISGPWTGGDGALDSGSVRLGLLWEPSEAWTVLFKADYNYIDMGAYPADPVLATNDPFKIGANAEQKALDKFGRAVLKIDYRFAGGTTLRSVTGFQDGNSVYRADLDGTSNPNDSNPFAAPWPLMTFRDVAKETMYSQEFNLISPDASPLRWVLGAYYQSNDYKFPPGEFVVDVFPDITPDLDPVYGPYYRYVLQGTNDTWNAAGFGQVSYDFATNYQLQFGLRYTEAHTANDLSVWVYSPTEIAYKQSASYSNWSGKIALNWKPNDQNFLYGFAASGFKPGGLNVAVAPVTDTSPAPAPFDEEKVLSLEAGWKWRSADGHLNTQLTAFYNDYDNFQVIVGDPINPRISRELNVPNTTTIYGFEAQVQAMFGRFSIDGGFGTLSSSLGEFYAVDPRLGPSIEPCDPKSGPETARCVALKGNEQTYAPNFTFNVGAQFNLTLGNDDALTPRISYAHVSSQWATLFENEALGDKVEARNIWNAQLAWTHGRIVTTLYGTNISDQHYVGAVNSGLRFAGPPIQYGLRVMTTF